VTATRLLLCAAALAGCTVTGPPVLPAQVGYVTLSQDTTLMRGELDAVFQIDQCVRRSVGPCDLVDCSVHDGGTVMPAGAGTVSVSGIVGLTVSVVPGPDGTYPPSTLQGQLWTSRTSVTFFSNGGTVPKFSQMLDTPSGDLKLLSPFGGPITIDSSHDYNVTWGTPLDNDQVRMRLSLDAGATLTCVWSGTDLMDAIPSLALSLLPAGTGSWRIDSVQHAVGTDGDWVLQLEAAQAGHDTNHLSSSGLLTVQ
jgi:hypothetical protein